MRVLADASLLGLKEAFPPPFLLSTYRSKEELTALLPLQDVLVCRSTCKIDANLLSKNQLQWIATASSGIDHIQVDYLKREGIGLLDAKGSNAVSVANYVMASMASLQENQQLGKSIGILGMGEVGSKVYAFLKALGFMVYAYDPPKAARQSDFQSCSLEALYQCDVLCIHSNLHQDPPYPTLNLIDKVFLEKLKPACILINAARGGIVNEEALLNHAGPLVYCTDVYLHEPTINKEIIARASLCTPHIAGHSLEAKYNAVNQLSLQLHRIAKLPPPQLTLPSTLKQIQLNPLTWQKEILSIYNPLSETKRLKAAENKEVAFLSVRKNHLRTYQFFVV